MILLLMLAVAPLSTVTHVAARPASARHSRTGLRRASTTVLPEESSSPAPDATPAIESSASSFEELMRTAEPLADLATLLIPPSGGCLEDAASIERARCEASRAFLRRTLPQRTFWVFGDDSDVLRVSPFDATIKGYHLSTAGCLACAKPLPTGNAGESRYVTLRLPGEGASLREAVEINRSAAGFETEAEASSWWRQADGNLRVQFVFQPALAEWTQAVGRGYAMRLLGFRVFNRCTHDVLVSRPPSTGTVDVGLTEGCLQNPSGPDTTGPSSTGPVRSALSAQDLAGAMSAIRPQVFACFDRFKVPGRAQLGYVVLGNGSVQSVRLEGMFMGTPTGDCVLEAARNARFPAFSAPRQRFDYPFFLRAQ